MVEIPGRRPRVLVVEDEPTIRDLLLDHLSDEGYEPHGVATLESAWGQLAASIPDLIVLDLMLPGQSGWDFLRIRAGDPVLAAVPVLVASAASRDDMVEAEPHTGTAFLSKPFDLDEFSELAQSLLQRGAPALP